jgi:hypothetical protein
VHEFLSAVLTLLDCISLAKCVADGVLSPPRMPVLYAPLIFNRIVGSHMLMPLDDTKCQVWNLKEASLNCIKISRGKAGYRRLLLRSRLANTDELDDLDTEIEDAQEDLVLTTARSDTEDKLFALVLEQ